MPAARHPCQVLVRDGSAPGCCTYAPRNCAAEFGNDPDFTYSCQVVGSEGVCRATPTAPPPVATANLSGTKADAPDPVGVGQPLTYTVTVSNAGPDPATGVTLVDTLPAGVTFVSVSPSQGSCAGASTVNCTLGNLASGSNATVTLRVTPNAPGAISNRADVTANEDDPDTLDNTTTATTTVNGAPMGTCNGLTPSRVGTESNDVLRGTNGNDVIVGNDGNDSICGGAGRDALTGGNGNDALFGEGDNDALAGGNGNDVISGGDGNDALAGANGNDSLDGGAATDACSGGSGSDTAVNCEAQSSIP